MKRDLMLVLVVAALAVAAFLVSAESAPLPPHKDEPVKRAARVSYRTEGQGSIAFFEVEINGPQDAAVRYQARGGPVTERAYPLSEAAFRDLLDRLSRAGFLDAEEVPRSGYNPDLATTTVAFSLGDQQNKITIDGRRRASRDLASVLDFFKDIRKAVTPEPVATGD